MHEDHPAVVSYQKYLSAYRRSSDRLSDHLTDISIDANEINEVALMSAVAEFEAGMGRARELRETAPFPDPASFRLLVENEVRFMKALFSAVCD